MAPWLSNLIANVLGILGPGWAAQPTVRGSYFFKNVWQLPFAGWSHHFPPFHFFINNYTTNTQNLYCIIRFEIQEIFEKRNIGTLTPAQVNAIPLNVFQFFMQNGLITKAQRDINIGHNPFCVDVNEIQIVLPVGFWNAPPLVLPPAILAQVNAFLNSVPTTNFRLL